MRTDTGFDHHRSTLRVGDIVTWIHDDTRKPTRMVVTEKLVPDYAEEGGYWQVIGIADPDVRQRRFGRNLVRAIDPDMLVDEGL